LYSLKQERAHIQERINELRKEKLTLEGEKTKLKTDYKYIEELAREKYRMAKKGEKVFKVMEKKKKD
ncbi:MAG: septum formation initiator family protein, partial [Gammaproteobacteria bacterium]|nr:septum formation initiator family protein [Gammaproteobacteria bacterium]